MARPSSELSSRPDSNPAAMPVVGQTAARLRLDLATVLGIVGAFALISTALTLGGSLTAFIDAPAMLIVIAGTIAVTTISFSLGEVFGTQRVIVNTILHRSMDPDGAARAVLRLAEFARRNSVLDIERELPRLRGEPFLRQGLSMVVDGTPSEEIERIMRRDLHAIQARHARSAGVLRRASEVSPAMGLIGTLIGLIQMLGHLDDPAAIGPGMAVALITTFYGAVLSTLVFAPLAAKLERNSGDETLINQIYLLGCLSIGRQENPRRLETQLNALLPPARRIKHFT